MAAQRAQDDDDMSSVQSGFSLKSTNKRVTFKPSKSVMSLLGPAGRRLEIMDKKRRAAGRKVPGNLAAGKSVIQFKNDNKADTDDDDGESRVGGSQHELNEEEEDMETKFSGVCLFEGGFNNGFNIICKRQVGDPIRIHIHGVHHPDVPDDNAMCSIQLGNAKSKLPSIIQKEEEPKNSAEIKGVWKGSMYKEADIGLD
ncbi:hypothetical protein WDU94_001472 [Cyamophila willieti]